MSNSHPSTVLRAATSPLRSRPATGARAQGVTTRAVPPASLARRLSRPARFALCLLPLVACAFPQEQKASDLPFRTGTITRWENGAIRKGRLVEKTRLHGLPVEHWAHFYEDGTPEGLRLAEDAEVAGHRLPRKTYVWFDEEGRLKTAWLSKDLEIDGVLCNGGVGKIATYFHPNGRLKTVFLVDDAVIQGIPCQASLFHSACFDEQGRLIECTLSRAIELDGVRREYGERVTLTPK